MAAGIAVPVPAETANTGLRRFAYMLGLILAGEAVFALPFHVARFFRPTVLEVFGLTNTELGAAQGVYGILALLAYLPGGPLADRYPTGKLLAFSLWSTAAGGLYMATLPGYRGALALWGFFGLTTILLFWAALIRATRNWGASDEQGRAYGLLEGGRGLVAAVLATLAIGVFGALFPEDVTATTQDEKKAALRAVIFGYTAITAAAGVYVWFAVADHGNGKALRFASPDYAVAWARLAAVMRMPAVWLQGVIVTCAYVGYKGFDNYSLYAVEAYSMNEVDAAGVMAIASWTRPVAAVAAGFLGDRTTVSRMTVISFAALLASTLFFALDVPNPGSVWVLMGNTLLTCAAIFGLRGLYFALFEEARVPISITGTAVGLVSVLGFTPDIFVSFVGGGLLDRSPGIPGHQHFFYFLASFAAIGLAASWLLMRRIRRTPIGR